MHLSVFAFVGVYLASGSILGAGLPVLAEATGMGLSVPYAVLGGCLAIALALFKLAMAMGALKGELSTKVDNLITALGTLSNQVEKDRDEHRDALRILRSDLESEVSESRAEFGKAIGSVRKSLAEVKQWKDEQIGAEKARRKSA